MTKYFNKFSETILLTIFIILFSLTVYSLISSNEIVRDAELIQYLVIADFAFLLILLIYLILFLINYFKSKRREIVGLRLFNKFFLFFGLFSIIPSGIILLTSAIFFNIEMSTWLGPAFKSTVNNSYQLAQKYIDQTEKNLITDSKFIRNYVLAERLIDRNIIQRFDIMSVYNISNDQKNIEHFTEDKVELSKENLRLSLENTENDITIFYENNQLFSKINLSENNFLILLKSIDLELLNYYQNIIESYKAINSIDQNKKNIQITFFTIYIILSTSLILIFIIIGGNFSFKLAKPIRELNTSIIALKKGNFKNLKISKSDDKDDISQLTNSFYSMSNTIINQRLSLEKTNITINDQLNFINNIIKNSPYGIFVLNNNNLIFQNSASSILSQNNLTAFESFKKIMGLSEIKSGLNDNKNFEKNINFIVNKTEKSFFVKSLYIPNNSLFDQLIIFNDYTNLIAAEKNNAIADLARKISHEIKNPLTPMLLSTEYLESEIDNEDLKNSIQSIKRQIFLIQNLVNEFSNFARLPKAINKKINLSEILSIYIEEYKRNYPKITFNQKINKDIYIFFDQSYIDIILNNLFKNSIEALEKTSDPSIEISLIKSDNYIVFTFFDNGPGYDKEVNNLLKPYFSTKNSSGLGLSLISKIIKENNGILDIKTNKYSGFKVEIKLNV
ncbi:ATP-binding protein [Alphaproteobacteria bacterium]|nr:ATP-binding protein [Alphaproteobacteria bacterium]